MKGKAMNYFRACLLAIVASLAWVVPASAQYYDSRVLEKSFDKMDMFFTPSYVNPYGFQGFGPVAPGLISNSILDLQLNPAMALTDSVGTSNGYLDFRQSRSSASGPDFCCNYLWEDAVTDRSIYYPYYPQNRVVAPEPIFVAAYQARPTRGFAIGFSYQLLFRDSDYFGVSADIYRASATEDFFSNRVVGPEAYPITDVRSGVNNMRTVGHQAAIN
ncbi:MAG: hypothetical protein HKN13_05605, partial [Rhodothermales bacterium]|nr:hypothetical protein [Rhodothermales bacterium]